MNKNKVKFALYAIMRNESQYIEKFLKSIYNNGDHVDYVCVLDTGSTDDSINVLKNKAKEIGFTDNQIIVQQKTYDTFRFDVARNDSMKLIPSDASWCISIDLDEVLEKNYMFSLRKVAEAQETEKVGFMQYWYAWSVDPITNNPIRKFLYCKCHVNDPRIRWIYPIHEKLNITEELLSDYKICTVNDSVLVYHYPDLSKSRTSYLDLLLIRDQEYPMDPNTQYYIGREYGFRKDWINALNYYNKIWFNYYTNESFRKLDLNALKHAYWNMAEVYRSINAVSDAEHIYEKALKECPCQMIYMAAAWFYAAINKPDSALQCVEKCLDSDYSIERDQDFRLETVYYRKWFINFVKAWAYLKLNNLNLSNKFFNKAFEDIHTQVDQDIAYVNRFYLVYNDLIKQLESLKLFENGSLNKSDYIGKIPERFIGIVQNNESK